MPVRSRVGLEGFIMFNTVRSDVPGGEGGGTAVVWRQRRPLSAFYSPPHHGGITDPAKTRVREFFFSSILRARQKRWKMRQLHSRGSSRPGNIHDSAVRTLIVTLKRRHVHESIHINTDSTVRNRSFPHNKFREEKRIPE